MSLHGGCVSRVVQYVGGEAGVRLVGVSCGELAEELVGDLHGFVEGGLFLEAGLEGEEGAFLFGVEVDASVGGGPFESEACSVL